jgi:hypothetical protein
MQRKHSFKEHCTCVFSTDAVNGQWAVELAHKQELNWTEISPPPPAEQLNIGFSAINDSKHAHKADFNPSHNTLNHYSNVAQIVKDALACCHGISNANFKYASM